MTRWRSLLLVPCCLGALAACSTLTPDYARPADAAINRADVQEGFTSPPAEGVANGPVLDQWWHLYRNDELSALVEQALSTNTDLRVALANLAYAESGVDVARDQQLPQVEGSAAPRYGRRSAEEELVPGPLSNQRSYSLGASVSYQVDLFGQIQRSIESAQASSDAARAAVASVRMTVAARTVQNYLAACAAGRELAVAERSIDIQAQATRLAQRRHADGRTASLDVTRSTTQEAQLRATLPSLEKRRRTALYRLAVMTGLPPARFPADMAGCVQEPTLSEPIPVGDGRALLARRPDIVRAENELRASTADLGVVTANLYPRISLGLSGGSVGLMNNFLDSDTYKFSLGPLISWQFPNRRLAQARVAGAQARIDAAFARFDGVVLAALQEVEVALTAYGHDLDQLGRLKAAQRSASKASSDARLLYEAGRESFLSVIDADRNLLAIEQTVAAQQTVIADDQVQLFLALGGGWQGAPGNVGVPALQQGGAQAAK